MLLRDLVALLQHHCYEGHALYEVEIIDKSGNVFQPEKVELITDHGKEVVAIDLNS